MRTRALSVGLSRVLPLVLSVCAMISAAPANTQERPAPQPGPAHVSNLEVGELPPSNFRLPTLDGEVLSLEEARGAPLMLLFFRGTW